MTDNKQEQTLISKKEIEEWSQVLHGEIPADQESETHSEAVLVRNYLIARDEAKAIDSLPAIEDLNTISAKEARVIYHQAAKEIERRGTSWFTRLQRFLMPAVIGGLSVTVVFLLIGPQGSISPSNQGGAQETHVNSEKNVLDKSDYHMISFGEDPGPYPNMLLIDGGEVEMGCQRGWDDSGQGCRDSEHPAHTVQVQPFEIAQHEVTVGQFRKFVEESGYVTLAEADGKGCTYQDMSLTDKPFDMDPKRSWRNPGFVQNDTHPVTCVSWMDAQAYLSWLNKETGRKYRLPSEAEWEYAARGGKATAYFWGGEDNKLSTRVNYKGDKDGWSYTSPVGSFPANAYGLQDTSGNVWEWVQDCWHETYQGAPNDSQPWQTNCSAIKTRTRRGGGWDRGAGSVRSAIRSSGAEGDRSYVYGFRVAHDYVAKE